MNTRQFASGAAVLAAAVVLAVVAAPAFADKGGNHGGGGTTTTTNSGGGSGGGGGGGGNSAPAATSSIALATVNGAAGAQPTLGASVTFATVAAGLSGSEWPMVSLACFEDVDHNGVVNTTVGGPDQVYGELDPPSSVFSLGGGSSLWLVVGGSATCTADLMAYGFKGGSETVRTLASTGAWAAAG
jgi:hypothetical protein